MPYTLHTGTIDPRDPELPFEEVGPGLYADETVYELDSGELVAASIRTDRHGPTGGLTFRAWVRAINEDGSTKLDTLEQEVEIEHHHLAAPGMLEKRGSTDIAKDVLHLLLGEPLAKRDVDGEQAEWLAVSDEVREALSIRNALTFASDAAGSLDVSALLS